MNFSMFWLTSANSVWGLYEGDLVGLQGSLFSKSLKNHQKSKYRYEKNTEKNFPFQKFDLKLDLGSNCICSSSDVYNHSRIRHHSKRTKIYENLSRTICVCDTSKELECQTTDGTYLLSTN